MMELLMISFFLDTSHLHQHKPHSLHTLIPLPLMTNNQLIMVFPYLAPHHHPLIFSPETTCPISHLTLPNNLLQEFSPQINPTLLPLSF
ncbi:hypothetical protein AMTRI_Chr11g151610 [Amborella trichopoda]